MSFSFNDRLLIDTPVVNLTFSFLSLIISTDFPADICDILYLHFIFSSNVKSLSIIILSATAGIPDKPNLVAIIPELIIPFLDKLKSSACCIIKVPKSLAEFIMRDINLVF